MISTQVDPLTVTGSSITLTPSVAGTVTLASDGVTLQFARTANLAAATTYTVHVSGFKDVNGNTVTPFTSTFLTNGTTETTAPTVTVNPASGATIATLTTPVVFTFSEPINPQTVNSGACTRAIHSECNAQVAGTLAVSGGNTIVTFTPIRPGRRAQRPTLITSTFTYPECRIPREIQQAHLLFSTLLLQRRW